MGTTKTFKRKVTFTITKANGKRLFTPVNKRAKEFAVLADKDQLSSRQLKAIRKLGYVVAESPTLKTITL
jgi:hypothetical protein